MIRNNRRVAALAIGGALTITPAVTGCGAGFDPQTSRPSQPPLGVNIQVPPDTSKPALVQIRNLFILGAADGQPLSPPAAAPVYADLIDSNSDGQPDSLISVSSPAFTGGAQITGGAVQLPPNQLVSLNTGTAPLVVLKGLSQQLFGGQPVSLTLRFARAGEVTVLAPIAPWSGPFATYPPAPSATPTPTAPTGTPGTGSGSPTPGAPKKTPGATASPTATPAATPSATP